MNITILDFAIVVAPLGILAAVVLSRVRESMSQQIEKVSAVKRGVLRAHIEMLRAKANRNVISLRRPPNGMRKEPRSLPLASGQKAAV